MANIIQTAATSFTKVSGWPNGPLKPTVLSIDPGTASEVASDVSQIIIDNLGDMVLGESLTIICTVVGGYEP